ncbi:MAG: phosphoheptose isomerase [Chitinophagaceae bacterium]|nr:phosphoheptose isomerase [Chitinophagaceae bacterium]
MDNIADIQEVVFSDVKNFLDKHHLSVIATDDKRPWGGFFVLDEKDAEKFIALFFPHLTKEEINIGGKLSPKILIVGPNKRLSWQYHHRRAEIWKLIGGAAKVATSDTDEETEITNLNIGDIVQLSQGQRHRLIGDENNWGIVAEIWQHTNAQNPSDEDDIVRLQDDFGR